MERAIIARDSYPLYLSDINEDKCYKYGNVTILDCASGKEDSRMNKFLDLKEKQEKKEVEEKFDKEMRETKEKDEIVKIMREAEACAKELDEDFNLKYFPTFDYITKETKKKISELLNFRTEHLKKIGKKYEEIRALCEGGNWEECMKIYKMYGLIED